MMYPYEGLLIQIHSYTHILYYWKINKSTIDIKWFYKNAWLMNNTLHRSKTEMCACQLESLNNKVSQFSTNSFHVCLN